MKKICFWTVILLGISLLISGCDWWLDTNPDDGKIPENVNFYTGCPLAFYFVDENGNTLVDINDAETYPISFRGAASESAIQRGRTNIQTYEQEGVKLYVYNDGANSLCWIEEDQQFRFQSYFWGVTPQDSYTFPVYVGSDGLYDKLTVGYKYVTTADKVQISGATWAVDVVSVKYNDVEVFVGNENGKVYIVKPSQGETTIKIGSL